MPEPSEASHEASSLSDEVSSDTAIVGRVLNGDLASFEIIMRRYNQRIFRIVRGVLCDDDEAEDVLQETYLRAYSHLKQFKGDSKFSTWLIKIALNESFLRRRRAQRIQAVDFELPENYAMQPRSKLPSAEQDASTEELRMLLTEAVDSLPDDLRVVFAMRIIEGVDTSDSANCLNLTEANVKVRLHRARAVLRQRIDAQIGMEARKLYQFGGVRCDRVVQTVLGQLSQRAPQRSVSDA